MDILDQLQIDQPNPLTLDDLVNVPVPSPVPLAAARNRAASTAMLNGDPTQAVASYRLMMRENEAGVTNGTQANIEQAAQKNTASLDLKGVMGVLSDPKLPLPQKQEALRNFQTSQLLKDNATTLLTNSLVAGSEGEHKEQEDARISSVDSIRQIYKSWNDVQGIQNAHGATLDPATSKTFFDMLELYVMPFGNSINAGKVANKQAEKDGKPLSFWQKIKNYALPGNATASLAKRLENIPPEKRAEFAKSLVDTISANSGIVFSNNNQFAQFDKASTILENGGYGSFQQFLDNVSPLLDLIGVGQLFRGAAKGIKAMSAGEKAAQAASDNEKVLKATWELVDDGPYHGHEFNIRSPRPQIGEGPKLLPYEDTTKRIEMNSVVRQEHPVAPANIIQQANPEQARTVHEAVFAAKDDQIAEGLYGVNREQAIINDITPQVATASGAVTSKTPNIQKNMLQKIVDDNKDIIDLIDNTGAIYFTREEKAQVAAKVNDFKNAEGLTMNEPMSSFKIDGGKLKIDAVYGLAEGSFLKAQDAINQAKLALRNYGVTDADIQLLKKEGLDHVPVALEDVSHLDGNYLIRVKTSHEIDPTDISNLSTFDVKRNFFDRVQPWLGKLITSPNRWLFDAASTLHPVYTGAATVAVDATSKFEKTMLAKADKYAVGYKGLDRNRKAKVDDYIREANYNGVAFDRTDLVARGFSPNEINVLKDWRDFWDAHFYLENRDVVRTLNSQGFQYFKNANTELYAKPISKDGSITRLYDPSVDSVVTHSRFDMDALYATNGTYARLRRPTDFGGVTATHMIVRNTPQEYLRTFNHTDQVLNYRNGYFQIQYKAPKFVDEITRNAQGVETSRRAVAVAGDTPEAQTFATRMQSTTDIEHTVRGDNRALVRGGDDWWDLNSASGRIAQRHRGQLLQDASGLNHLGDGSYIIDPVDSAVRSAKSISGRTVNRPMLEAAKARAINQYGDMFPSNGVGGRRWPSNASEIGLKGEPTSSRIADARTTYEYINFLENGYINNVDTAFKALMNAMADMTGRVGLGRTERGLNELSHLAPTSLGKNFVFSAYIGTNPLRQLIVQPHQLIRMFSYNPIGMGNGSAFKLMTEYLGEVSGLTHSTDFSKWVEKSGTLAGVDKQNLVRGALRDAADASNPVIKAVGKANAVPRIIGFDTGEKANMLGHMAAVWDKNKRAGRDVLDKIVQDEMVSEARAISYEMNFSGDMPYNQTSPAVVLQFMQVPHKALLQMTNRRIPWQVRARMVSFDMLMWGTPVATIASFLGTDLLPDDPETREKLLYGFESFLFNNMFNELWGDTETKINVDLSSLAPYDMHGWQKFFAAVYGGGMDDMLLNSPAGQIFLKDGGRMRNAMASMQRYFAGFIEPQQLPEDFIGMLHEVAKISSGYSNAHKATILLDAKKQFDKYGKTIDKDVNYVEAMAQVFGFGTADARDLYETSQSVDKKSKAYKDEVLSVYKSVKQYYQSKLEEGNTDPRFITSVTGFILNKYKDEPVAMQIIASELEKDIRDGQDTLLYKMMKASGLPDPGSLKDDVRRSPISEDQKKMIMDRIDDVQNSRTEKEK